MNLPLLRINRQNAVWIAGVLALASLAVRMVVWYATELFRFSDYQFYMQAADRIIEGQQQLLREGNMLFAISHIAAALHRLSGSYNLFFIFNSILGTAATLLVYRLIVRTTGNFGAGLITMGLLLIYTEFQVFSSVFYTPVIMLFLVALLLNLLHEYIAGRKLILVIATGTMVILVYLLTFFFKPELRYLPWFMLIPAVVGFALRDHIQAVRLLVLVPVMQAGMLAINSPQVITSPEGNVISNSFVFFGHTDYGGNGGEGAFIYEENRERYNLRLEQYLGEKGIGSPSTADYNAFQREEIKRFITGHPFRWAALQVRKFFGTFGIVPESTSFRVLHTGLLKGHKWLTAFVVSAPVALIILLTITLVRPGALAEAFTHHRTTGIVMLTLLAYYLIATIFYGQYQERYRLPLMVLFIIPALGMSVATFDRAKWALRRGLILRALIIMIFITSWTLQALSTLGSERLSEVLLTTPD